MKIVLARPRLGTIKSSTDHLRLSASPGGDTCRVPEPPAIHYYFSDHLGSTDIVTNASGIVEEEREFYPFGGERVITDSGIGNNYKFTGKERDPETGLDEFGARYYPYGPKLEWLKVPEICVRFLWALPITTREAAFAELNGYQLLKRSLTLAQLNYLDPFRPSVV